MLKKFILFITLVIGICGMDAKKITLPELDISTMPQLEKMMKNVISDCKFINDERAQRERLLFKLGFHESRSGQGVDVQLIDSLKYINPERYKGFFQVNDAIIIVYDIDIFKELCDRKTFELVNAKDEDGYIDDSIDWVFVIDKDRVIKHIFGSHY